MKNTFPLLRIACLAALFIQVMPGLAALTVAPLFSDRMVVDYRQPWAVYGTADPGAPVTVTFESSDGDIRLDETSVADNNGVWTCRLPAVPARTHGRITIRAGMDSTIEIRDVAFGVVWFCAGQSNMAFGMGGFEDDVAEADDPDLRMASFRRGSGLPETEASVKWVPATPHWVKRFSAVGYYFGSMLRRELDMPVGLIQSAYNATRIESWMPMETLRTFPFLADDFAEYEELAALCGLEPDLEDVEKAPADKRKRVPGGQHALASLYNGMVHPFITYPISGFIWYQGESNVGNAAEYAEMFPAMIASWRKRWNRGNLPFLYVELAGYKAPQSLPVEEDATWPKLREAQRAALALPNTAVATAIDVGSATDIHPPRKQPVGERLAMAALQTVYGRDGILQSPRLAEAHREGSSVRLTFHHAGGELSTKDGQPPHTFALLDRQGIWHAASADIDGGDIVVMAEGVESPREVRYAWAMNPESMNVVNKAGLPLLPLRSILE